MKKIILFLLLISAIGQAQETQAVLKGGLETAFISKKHLTTTERDAIIIEEGKTYEIYNITTGQNETWNGTAWINTDNTIPKTENYTTLGVITGESDGDLIYVTDDNFKGLFKYDSTLSATIDYGIIINGWVRQFEGNIQAEWFDAGGDDDFNINFALLAAGNTPVEVNKDITINSAILIDDDQTIDFKDVIITPIAPMTSSTVIKNRDITNKNITIKGGHIVGTALTTIPYNAVILDSVFGATVKDMKITDVSILAAVDTGNILITQSEDVIVDNVDVRGTWRAGVYFFEGQRNTIKNSYFTETRDSGIIMVNSDYGTIQNNTVDNCGQGSAPDGASNIAANLVNGLFKDNISINAGGTVNGNGFTLGHPLGYDAHNSVIVDNYFGNNATKGLFLQGTSTDGNIISNNVFENNGVGSTGTNSSGLGIAGGVRNIISNNTFDGNRYGISVDVGAISNVISSNLIENSTSAGIRNAGTATIVQNNIIRDNIGGSYLTTSSIGGSYINNNEALELNSTLIGNSTPSANMFSNALQRMKMITQTNNQSLGISMATSTTNLYGMMMRTERLTGGTDFQYAISAHKNTEEGVDVLKIDDVGLTTLIQLSISTLPTYADEAAAVTGGIPTGTVYKTATGELRIKL